MYVFTMPASIRLSPKAPALPLLPPRLRPLRLRDSLRLSLSAFHDLPGLLNLRLQCHTLGLMAHLQGGQFRLAAAALAVNPTLDPLRRERPRRSCMISLSSLSCFAFPLKRYTTPPFFIRASSAFNACCCCLTCCAFNASCRACSIQASAAGMTTGR